MNSLKNDRGEWVAQEGAPMSNARIKCQHPALIERLKSLFCQEAKIDVAIEEIRAWGIKDGQETCRILEQTPYMYSPMYGIVKAVSK